VLSRGERGILRKEPFDGDPHKFRLGVEALRLELAYEYDPCFSLSITTLTHEKASKGSVHSDLVKRG